MTSIVERARERVRGTGARVTGPRVRVLATLMRTDEALSHAELQSRLAAAEEADLLDRVTLYRVLEWLTETGLVHRVSGPDRVWRFSSHGGGHAARAHHGHFKCRSCERMFCMKESGSLARTVRAMLPSGFEGDEVELTVVGLCPACAAAARPRSTATAAAG